MPVCYIVGAGDFTARDLVPQPEDFVIAADGGYALLKSIGITPDLLVGDFDSLAVKPDDVRSITFPVEKDDTDMGLAVREGAARGYREFALYGADGGRLDHTLANLQLLGGLSKQGCKVRLVGKALDIYAVTQGTLQLPARESGTLVSVFCHGDQAEGVTLQGLKYPLLNACLTCDWPLGVSNEYADTQASVSVAKGTLLVLVALQAKH